MVAHGAPHALLCGDRVDGCRFRGGGALGCEAEVLALLPVVQLAVLQQRRHRAEDLWVVIQWCRDISRQQSQLLNSL